MTTDGDDRSDRGATDALNHAIEAANPRRGSRSRVLVLVLASLPPPNNVTWL